MRTRAMPTICSKSRSTPASLCEVKSYVRSRCTTVTLYNGHGYHKLELACTVRVIQLAIDQVPCGKAGRSCQRVVDCNVCLAYSVEGLWTKTKRLARAVEGCRFHTWRNLGCMCTISEDSNAISPAACIFAVGRIEFVP